MNYTTRMNEISARIVTKLVSDQFSPKSIVDFGCAQGGWLKAWQKTGVTGIQGVDGAYVDQSSLLIAQSQFKAADLCQPVELHKTFDMAQCVEVAEHLSADGARIIVKNLTRHAPVVLFSSAPPGQGGRGHINEQPYEYWRDLFAEESYDLYDWVRPQIANRKDVQPWYRYNLFLFVHSHAELPEAIRQARVPPHTAIPDVSSPLYQLRKMLVRLIPKSIQDIISNLLAARKI